MNLSAVSKFQIVVSPLTKSAALAVVLAVSMAQYAHSAGTSDDDATKILKQMTDYVAAQQTISLTYDSDIEVVTTELQKISFASSGQLLIKRPDKIRANRIGGYADVELVFDGKTLSILSKNLNSFAQVDAPGTVEQLIEKIRDGSGASLPGADLFSATAYADLTEDLAEAKHIGRGIIGGVECEHLAFRTPEVDWQLWVELGPNPIPRKYVITSKTVATAPQYTVQIKDWRTDATTSANSFVFNPPQGASKVAAESLRQIDEIPAGAALAARK